MKKLMFSIFLIIVISLIITNPSEKDYKNNMMMTEIKTKSLNPEVIQNAEQLLDMFTIRYNYVLFSTFEYKTPKTENEAGRSIRYIGLLNNISKMHDEKIQ